MAQNIHTEQRTLTQDLDHIQLLISVHQDQDYPLSNWSR